MNRNKTLIDPLIKKQYETKPQTDFDAIIADQRRRQAHVDAREDGKITNGGEKFYDVIIGADNRLNIVPKRPVLPDAPDVDPDFEADLNSEAAWNRTTFPPKVAVVAVGTVIQVDFNPSEYEVPVHVANANQNLDVAS